MVAVFVGCRRHRRNGHLKCMRMTSQSALFLRHFRLSGGLSSRGAIMVLAILILLAQATQQPAIRPLPEPVPLVPAPVFPWPCAVAPPQHPDCLIRQMPQHDWPPDRIKVERRVG
jgi:hypothetical protein